MSTLSDPAARAAIRERVQRLTPSTPRHWGRMTPHQMICHLSDAYRLSSGERPVERVDNFFSRLVVRWVALHTPMQWPHGIKTMPGADQEIGGTKPVEWDRDHAELVRMIEAFDAADGRTHPIFGPLTREEWSVWGWRHADHHLRQFGL